MADGERSREGSAAAAPAGRSYAAFISYSHADEEIAHWLHKRLEGYRVPAVLAKGRPERSRGRRLGKVFRDRVELSAAHDLGGEIRKALEASDALIVLCSPRSAGSRYVEEEIRTFKALGRGDHIFAAIVDGEPHAAGKPGRDASEECFPRALLYRVGEDGALIDEPEPVEPIAADVRVGKDGRENGALKLIAGLLDVGLDELVQREKQAERARRRRTQIVAGVMAVLALGAAAAGGVAWWQQGVASQERDRATANEALAKTNEARATQNEQKANANFAEAETQRLAAEKNAQEREIQRLLAEGNAQEARDTLHRFYATRAWEKFDASQLQAGARYALAGLALSQANTREYHTALAGIMQEAGETLPPMTHDDEYLPVVSSPGGWRAVTVEENAALLWDVAQRRVVAKLEGQKGPVAAVFSPDGRRLVTIGADNTGKVWNAVDGKPVAALRNGDLTLSYQYDALFFSPDGQRIFTEDREGRRGRVWDAASGGLVATLELDDHDVRQGAFSPDGRLIVITDFDLTADLWDAATGRLVASLLHESEVDVVAFSPDGSRLAVLDFMKTASVWDVADRRLLATMGNWLEPADEAVFSPDGLRLLTWKNDGDMTNAAPRMWDAATGRRLFTLEGHRSLITNAVFSDDGKRILTGSYDGVAKVWNAVDGKLVNTLTGHADALSTALLAQDGKTALTVSEDNTLRVWTSIEGRLLATFGSSPDPSLILTLLAAKLTWPEAIHDAAFSPDGKSILTMSEDKLGRMWDSADGKLVRTLTGHTAGIMGVGISPDGARAYTTSKDQTTRVWDVAEGREIASFDSSDESPVRVAFAPNDARFFVYGRKEATVWGAREGAPKVYLSGNTGVIRRASFSPDGRRIVTAGLDKTASVWDAASGKLLLTLKGLPENAGVVLFSPDGRRIVTTSEQAAQLWDAADGRLIAILKESGGRQSTGGDLQDVVFSADGRRVVTRSPREARLWDASDGRLVADLSEVSEVTAVAFSPDGVHIVTGDEDRSVRLWSAADGKMLSMLGQQGDSITSVSYSRDGGRALSSGQSGVTVVWDPADGRQIAWFGYKDRLFATSFSRDGSRVLNQYLDTAELWDSTRATQPLAQLARDACNNLLGPYGRRFSQKEVDVDPLLRAEWSADRDVCEGVAGVPVLPPVKAK